ncbi:hypothetical protein [Janthinobacterium sp. 17J80-10]|uniref:hypothetical protein n=1 Tax=Janthinobacterium sp. 17J80-10 TaxID=2497863 RepID=UPI00100567E2|nr:hypothetical protein [Janthinobacterium sp. 17J80-10]QAU33780.1 hypothetical protein EKL02_06040 [Janthinobacterium sp. 17J80-10]
MSAHQMAHMAELENQAFSLMGRLHVALRRETGRITDVEYMRIDPSYCRHLIQVARQSGYADLDRIAERLETIYFGDDGLFVMAPPKPPLLTRLSAGLAAAATPGTTIAPEPRPPARIPAPANSPPQASQALPERKMVEPDGDQHYVGRLR